MYAVCYLRLFGAFLSEPRTMSFHGKCIFQIKKGADIHIGRNFVCYSGPRWAIDNAMISKITVLKGAQLRIGDMSGMSNTVLWCRNQITIGDYVNIGAGCLIMDNNFHSTDWRIRMQLCDDDKITSAPIEIKDHVFIGARSIICKGVTIGEHSIVAAGSVVVRDIPDNEVWGGNPAQYIKKVSNV